MKVFHVLFHFIIIFLNFEHLLAQSLISLSNFNCHWFQMIFLLLKRIQYTYTWFNQISNSMAVQHKGNGTIYHKNHNKPFYSHYQFIYKYKNRGLFLNLNFCFRNMKNFLFSKQLQQIFSIKLPPHSMNSAFLLHLFYFDHLILKYLLNVFIIHQK
jgi:hypothetical protein